MLARLLKRRWTSAVPAVPGVGLAASLVLTLPALADTPALSKPNLLMIVADDLGYADVGFNGGKTIATPNMDRLAATGVNLGNFRVCPVCSPTRAGLLTGRWPLRFGMMRAVVPPWSKYGLPAEEKTIADLLAPAGYEERGIIGKWHLGHARREFLPLNHGFTYFYGHYNGAINYFTHEREGECDWHRNWQTLHEQGYSTDLLGADAVRFIRRATTARPWFLYLPFNAPHEPYQATPEDLRKYPQLMPPERAYAAIVDRLDQTIGKVLDAVESRPDATNTLILFFSDNGGVLKVSSNKPWRGGKETVYEGGTHGCAAIRWPAAGLAGGKRFDGLIGYIDVAPTFLSAAGVKPPDNLDGINFLPALRGTVPLPDRPWFSYIHQSKEPDASVNEGPWKLVVHGEFFVDKPSAPPQLELYNLQTDPTESTDVASKHPDVVKRLHRELRAFGQSEKPGVGPYDEGRAGFQAPKDWEILQ